MNQAPHNPLSDELISAYIDGDVTEDEKRIIETAIAGDPEIAWQVESMRQTVHLLQNLPALALPRSFILTADMLTADILAAEEVAEPVYTADKIGASRFGGKELGDKEFAERSGSGSFLSFFSSGNLLFRNATAIAAVLFLALIVGEPLLNSPATLSVNNPPLAVEPASLAEIDTEQQTNENNNSENDNSNAVTSRQPLGDMPMTTGTSLPAPPSEAPMVRSAPSSAPMVNEEVTGSVLDTAENSGMAETAPVEAVSMSSAEESSAEESSASEVTEANAPAEMAPASEPVSAVEEPMGLWQISQVAVLLLTVLLFILWLNSQRRSRLVSPRDSRYKDDR